MAVWKIERRRAERYKVGWTGKLTCYFPDHEENIEVSVVEVSSGGARLEVETLQVGQYHLVIGSESSRFTLKVNLPEYAISVPVRIIWYSTAREKDAFNLGVIFLKTSAKVQETIDRIIKDVAPAVTGSENRE
jgi:c-di-GMP-binding flagellar brake protein YcgR